MQCGVSSLLGSLHLLGELCEIVNIEIVIFFYLQKWPFHMDQAIIFCQIESKGEETWPQASNIKGEKRAKLFWVQG